jgi:hypothetical protein
MFESGMVNIQIEHNALIAIVSAVVGAVFGVGITVGKLRKDVNIAFKVLRGSAKLDPNRKDQDV